MTPIEWHVGTIRSVAARVELNRAEKYGEIRRREMAGCLPRAVSSRVIDRETLIHGDRAITLLRASRKNGRRRFRSVKATVVRFSRERVALLSSVRRGFDLCAALS